LIINQSHVSNKITSGQRLKTVVTVTDSYFA